MDRATSESKLQQQYLLSQAASADYYKPLPSPYYDRLVKHVYYSLKNDPALSRDLARYYGVGSADNDD